MVLKMYKKILSFIILCSFLLICLYLFDTYFLFHQLYRNRDSPGWTVEPVQNQYGVIIDAGSSGSRLFIYTWPPHSGKAGELLQMVPLLDGKGQPVVKKVNPGLSSLADRPDAAGAYIEPLLDLAKQSVPKHQHKETPFYVMATAGMRMITNQAQTAILDNIRQFVRGHSEFLFSDSHAKVITGEEEGIFGWITTNYLLGRFSHNHTDGVPVVAVPIADSSRFRSDRQQHHRKRTVGTIDMGGGSMQIAYELATGQSDFTAQDSESRVLVFNLGCRDTDVEHTYKVFVTTFLGFGANSARDRYERTLLQTHLKQSISNHSIVTGNVTDQNLSTTPQSALIVDDPCLHRGSMLSKRVKLVNDSQGGLHLSSKQLKSVAETQVSFLGTGKYHLCEARLLTLLDKRPCSSESYVGSQSICTMSGRLHPPIDLTSTFFYGFSELWYSTQDVLGLGGPYNYFRVHSKALDHCGKDWLSLATAFRQGAFGQADWDRLRMQCFKSAWVTGVLHGGLAFPNAFGKLVSVHDINGAEVQWSLGALLYQTRYFPLRAIEHSELILRRKQARQNRSRPLSIIVYLFLAAAVTMIMATVFWMHWRRPATVYGRQSPSWSTLSSVRLVSSNNGAATVPTGGDGGDGGDGTDLGAFNKHTRGVPYFQF